MKSGSKGDSMGMDEMSGDWNEESAVVWKPEPKDHKNDPLKTKWVRKGSAAPKFGDICIGKSGIWVLVGGRVHCWKFNDGFPLGRVVGFQVDKGYLHQISCGASVWIVNRDGLIIKLADPPISPVPEKFWRGKVYYELEPYEIIPGPPMQCIAVSDKNRVWGVGKDESIWRRSGSSWERINGRLKHISVGESGVWGVQSDGNVYYRVGTYLDIDTAGSGWEKVPVPQDKVRNRMTLRKPRTVAVGTDMVAITADNEGAIYYREGICSENPTGTDWIYGKRTMQKIDISDDNWMVGYLPTGSTFMDQRMLDLLRLKNTAKKGNKL